MVTRRAGGFVVFRRMKNDLEYLLLQASNGKHHWTPPKGHVDPGEDDLTTALRETEEESGLKPSQLEVVPGFCREISYMAWGHPKVTAYYLAELREPEAPITLSDEHMAWRWSPVAVALRLVGHASTQSVLQQAHDFLSGAAAAGPPQPAPPGQHG